MYRLANKHIRRKLPRPKFPNYENSGLRGLVVIKQNWKEKKNKISME